MLLIVVSGPPATGKSNTALALSKKFRLPVLMKDSVKEILFDTLGIDNRRWSKQLGRASFELMVSFLQTILLSKRPVIIEGNFYGSTGRRMSQLAKRAGYTIIQIHCAAPNHVIKSRFTERWKSGRRHRGHHDSSSLSQPDLIARKKERQWRIGSERLVLDETSSERENIKQAKRFVQRHL